MKGWNGPLVEIPVAFQTLNKPHTPQWNKTHLRSEKGNRLNFWYISLKSGYRLNAMYVLKKQKRNLFLKKPGFQMIALSSSEQSLNDYTWGKRGWPCSHPCWFTSLKTTFDFTSFNVQGVKDNSPRSIYENSNILRGFRPCLHGVGDPGLVG